jgi:uncharacterized protein GlcG (DUF336 family)
VNSAHLSLACSLFVLTSAFPSAAADCPATRDELLSALKQNVQPAGGPGNGGLDNHMWASLVARDGTVCAMAFSGAKWDDQWPGSRLIAAQKANTANAFSVSKSAFSTAQMYAGAQPGGFLFGIQESNPVVPDAAYAGSPDQYGTDGDPMVGKRIGGANVFGGGLALYRGGVIVGGLGVSGDTSCGDHNVAWRVRHTLGLDKVPAGPASLKNDGIIYDIGLTGNSASGFGHPTCGLTEDTVAKDIGAGGTSAPK